MDKQVLTAIFQSARTTVDGGWRISFDVDESQGEIISQIVKMKEQALHVVVIPKESNLNDNLIDLSNQFEI